MNQPQAAPEKGDATVLVVPRLNACATRIDPKNTKVGPECQKAWTKFPLECARKATCADVMACMKENGR